MAYVKARIPTEVYHLTKRENVESIRTDKRIRRFGDTECWFCRTPEDMLRYMEYTVLCEGKPYIATGGRIEHYPKFVPEDHVFLKLTPSNGRISGTNGIRSFREMLPRRQKQRPENSLN